MNLQTYQNYSSIRNAVQSYTEAKRIWRSETVQARSSTDMEVDAVGKDGNKGKSKGGKGKSKNPKGDECLICGTMWSGVETPVMSIKLKTKRRFWRAVSMCEHPLAMLVLFLQCTPSTLLFCDGSSRALFSHLFSCCVAILSPGPLSLCLRCFSFDVTRCNSLR